MWQVDPLAFRVWVERVYVRNMQRLHSSFHRETTNVNSSSKHISLITFLMRFELIFKQYWYQLSRFIHERYISIYTRVNISKNQVERKKKKLKKKKKRRGFKEIRLKCNLGHERQQVICNTSFQREKQTPLEGISSPSTLNENNLGY